MQAFLIIFILSLVHLTISTAFFPKVAEFFASLSEAVYGRLWKGLFILFLVTGPAIWAWVISITPWLWVAYGVMEVYSYWKLYSLNKKLSLQ